MTDQPSSYAHLTFNSPLSSARARAIAARLAAAGPRDVVDIGCGWAELLLGVLEAAPSATGIGLDTEGDLIRRGQASAAARGLTSRVTLTAAAADSYDAQADVVLCVGASFALDESVPAALAVLHRLVRPGGRLLLGEGFWEPTGAVDESLVWPDVLGLPDLAGLVDQALAAGFRPLWTETASPAEWEEFESGYLADLEEWSMTHPDHGDVEKVRADADEHRTRWLRGYRNGWGFAYLTLGVPGPAT